MASETDLSKVGFFCDLPAPARAELSARGEVRTAKRGERVWNEGGASSAFTFVVRGHVKLVRALESGREAIVDTVGPGEIACGSAPCTFAPYCCSAVALENGTEVLSVPRRAVMEVAERDAGAARALMHEMASRGANLCRRVEELSSGQVAQRIARLLLRLAERAGAPRADAGIWVPVPLTRQDIADICNTTVESTIRVMTRWSREGVVRKAARGFVLADRARLERAAAGDVCR